MHLLILIAVLSLALALLNMALALLLKSRYARRYESARDTFVLLYAVVSIVLTGQILAMAEDWIFTATAPSVMTNTWVVVFIIIPLAFVDIAIGIFATGWMYVKLEKIYDPAQ